MDLIPSWGQPSWFSASWRPLCPGRHKEGWGCFFARVWDMLGDQGPEQPLLGAPRLPSPFTVAHSPPVNSAFPLANIR